MRHFVLLTSLALATAACRTTTDPGDSTMNPAEAPSAATRPRPDLRPERASLIAAGNAVSADIAAKGVSRGLSEALTSKALLLSPRVPTIQGREAIESFLASDPMAPSAMTWEVIAADVSNDASQGYTWSQGKYTIDLGTGASEAPAFFLTYWRRTESGRWRIAAFVLNLGGPQALPLPRGFGTPAWKHRRNFPHVELETLQRQLRSADAAFSALSVAEGTGPAFQGYAAPKGIAVSGGFVFGPEAIGEAFASEPGDTVSWAPRFAVAAESGDLGFTVGDAVFKLVQFGTFYTKYLTIWQRQSDGEWRFIADFGNGRPAP